MARALRAGAALLVVWVTLGSCSSLESRSNGAFSVHFTWAGEEPSAFQGWAYMRVESRPGDPNSAGKTVGTSGPTLFAPGAAMSFTAIPNQDNLVVVVELREIASLSGHVLYDGASAPFSLQAGKHVDVAVNLALVATPAATVGGTAALQALSSFTRDGNVILGVVSDRGVQLQVANALGFPAGGTQTFDMNSLQASSGAPAGYQSYQLPWSLGFGGVDLTCNVVGGCPHTVYAQIIDAQGYASDTLSVIATYDALPPSIDAQASLVSPAIANASSPVVVNVVASENLGVAPNLTVAGQGNLFTLVAQNGNTTFSFVSQSLAGAVWADGNYTVLAQLVDLAGNAAPNLAVGTFAVDSTLPGVNPNLTVLSPTSLKAGDTLSIGFTVDKTLARAPDVHVASTPVSGCVEAPVGTFQCTHVANPNEGDGIKPVTAQLLDDAGNLNAVPLGNVSYDVTPPGLAFSLIAPPQAAAGANVLVSLIFNEAVNAVPVPAVTPALPNGGLTYMTSPSTTHFDYAYTTPLGGSDASYAFTVTATDIAGNQSAALIVGTLAIDPTAPTLSSLVVPAVVNANDVANARPVVVTFSVSETLRVGSPQVRVGNHVATCTANGLAYTCSYVASTDADGVEPVNIIIGDLAGNVTTDTSQSVRYDLTAPTGILTASPALAAAGHTLTVRYVASEALAATPTLQVTLPDGSDGTARFGTPLLAETTYLWSYGLEPTDPAGVWSINLSQIQDAALNPGADANATIAVYQTPPVVLTSSVTPLAVQAGVPVTVTFTTSSAPATGYPHVTLGGTALSVSPTGNPNGYSAQGSLSGSDGPRPVQVTLADAAGNVSFATLPAVTLDTQITPGTLTVAPADAAAGSTITVQYVASETLTAPPTLAVTLPDASSGSALFGSPALAGLVYSWHHPLNGNELNGTWQYSVANATDLAGNIATPSVASGQVDQVAPAPNDPLLSPTLAMSGTAITLTFGTTKPLLNTPQVTLGDTAMTFGGLAGGIYTFTHTAQAGEGSGSKAVVALLTDMAGNVGSSTLGSVTYDFDPPHFAAGSVSYTPGPGNPLSGPKSATLGTTVFVAITASETLDTTFTPTLSAQSGGNVLSLSTTANTSATAYFQTTIDPNAIDGTYLLSVTFKDLAGNVGNSNFPVPAIVVDTSVPSVSSIDVTQVKHLRLPWGAQQSGGLPAQFLVAANLVAPAGPLSLPLPGAAFEQVSEASAQVRVYNAPVGGAVLGVSTPQGSNWLPVQLFSADSPAIWVSLVDWAGNESSRVRVDSIEWVASAGGLVAGDTTANPHYFAAHSIDWNILVHPDDVAVGASDGIGVPGDGQFYQTWSGPFWRQPPSQGPGLGGFTVYDSKRGRLILFPDIAGQPTNFSNAYVWEDGLWGPLAVTDPEGDGNPSTGSNNAASVVYDVARDRVVLLAEPYIWEFNGTSWVLQNLGSNLLYNAGGIIYDPIALVTLFRVVGTQIASWDGTNYLPITVGGTVPTIRMSTAMAFDPNRNVIVIQGGLTPATMCDGYFTAPAHLCRYTYELDASTWTWSQRPYLASDPNLCNGQNMAYDPTLQKILMYGGQSVSAPCTGTVWTYDANGWVQSPEVGDPNANGSMPGMAYSSRDGGMLTATDLFGGVVNQLMSLDGNSQRIINPNQAVSSNPNYPTASASIAYDGQYGGIIAFGGSGSGGNACSDCNTTWLWDGFVNWNALPTSQAPTARYGAGLVYDATRSTLWLFGGQTSTHGYLSDTWGLTSDWAPSGASGPTARSAMGMAFDANRSVAVLFGGQAAGGPQGDTWEFNGSAWTQRCVSCSPAPSPRSGPLMAYDSWRNVMLLFGGTAGAASSACPGPSFACNDTWSWDGAAWHNLTASNPNQVPPTGMTGMAFDSETGRTSLVGGTSVWSWNGSTWAALAPQDTYKAGATRSISGPVAFDANHLVLQAGVTNRLDNGAGSSPGHLFRVNLGALTLPAGASPDYAALAASWWVGGSGTVVVPGTTSTPSTGAQLRSWDSTGWTVRDTHTSDVSAPAELSWSTADPNLIARSIMESSYLYFATEPTAPGGGAAAGISTDAVEVRLNYTLTP